MYNGKSFGDMKKVVFAVLLLSCVVLAGCSADDKNNQEGTSAQSGTVQFTVSDEADATHEDTDFVESGSFAENVHSGVSNEQGNTAKNEQPDNTASQENGTDSEGAVTADSSAQSGTAQPEPQGPGDKTGVPVIFEGEDDVFETSSSHENNAQSSNPNSSGNDGGSGNAGSSGNSGNNEEQATAEEPQETVTIHNEDKPPEQSVVVTGQTEQAVQSSGASSTVKTTPPIIQILPGGEVVLPDDEWE